MRKGLLGVALGLFLTAPAAVADVLAVPPSEAAPSATVPRKGTTMADVERQFGAPRAKLPTVGGDTPKQPPITRWDYDGFSVIFEHDKVVDSVVPGAPPAIRHKDQLTSGGMTPPATAAPPAEAAPPADATPPPMEAAPPAEPFAEPPPPAEPPAPEPEQPSETPTAP